VSYQDFIAEKLSRFSPVGFDSDVNGNLFDFQTALTKWALRIGRAAIFADTGLGKTRMQLAWADEVRRRHGPVLILAPLAVAEQTCEEGEAIGVAVRHVRESCDLDGICITNYERVHKFDVSNLAGIVLDESSIIKHHDSKSFGILTELFRETPYKLCATATPAPNDWTELGTHAEFLGVCTRPEMLAEFFVHDMEKTQDWRLKGHARGLFWEWVASWGAVIRSPSDLGFDGNRYKLPKLSVEQHTIETNSRPLAGQLFAMEASTLSERRDARRQSIEERVRACVKEIHQSWGNHGQNIGEPTTQQIESEGLRTSEPHTHGTRKSAKPLMRGTGRRSTRNSSESTTERTTARTSRSTSTEAARSTCKGTDSESQSSLPCLSYSMADARSVSAIHQTGAPSILTMITKQAPLEDCYATPAICDSADTETMHAHSDQQGTNVRRSTSNGRAQWVVWVELNAEQDAIATLLGDDCVSIYGSLDAEEKVRRYRRFERGEVAVLVTKGSIFGYGVNMQFSSRAAFVGVTDSFEQYYQMIRRQWRFGQKKPVNVHVFASDLEGSVVANLKAKEIAATEMAEEMIEHTAAAVRANVLGATRVTNTYAEDRTDGNGWTMNLGDCVEVMKGIPDRSVGYSIFSPPFASLYTYSNSQRDMGNCKTREQFMEHFDYVIAELLRVMQPGRDVSFHCMLLPTSKVMDGVIGLKDFRGDLIRAFERHRFTHHSEVVIWKDPVTAMQRTKALGLLHKTVRNNSSMARQGIPDYLITMRAPGDPVDRVTHDDYPVYKWQRVASPVWTDINQSDTLQYRSAREHNDERHICPLQLEVIRRGIELWTNPGDMVLSPFAGIGSEGVVALELQRRFIGCELKRSYYDQACQNLKHAAAQSDMFAEEI
jgi:DNA modification methylase